MKAARLVLERLCPQYTVQQINPCYIFDTIYLLSLSNLQSSSSSSKNTISLLLLGFLYFVMPLSEWHTFSCTFFCLPLPFFVAITPSPYYCLWFVVAPMHNTLQYLMFVHAIAIAITVLVPVVWSFTYCGHTVYSFSFLFIPLLLFPVFVFFSCNDISYNNC